MFVDVVEPTPSIAVTVSGLDSNIGVVQGGSFNVALVLSALPDQNVGDQIINVANLAAAAGFTISPASCELTIASPSCVLTVSISGTTALTSYEGVLMNSSSVVLSQIDVDFQVITAPAKRIFVTSTQSNGNLGGFAGDNKICNQDANRPVDSTSFVALLSGATATHNGVAYFRPDGTPIGTASGSFLEQNLTHPISPAGAAVWTGADNPNCNSWTSSDGGITGTIGLANQSDSSWFSLNEEACNLATVSLYCVEQ